MNRTARLVGLAGLAVSSLVILPGGPATAEPSHWCTTSPAPCIVSVEHDGIPVPSSDPVWQVDLVSSAHDAKWDLKESGAYELTSASAGTWEVTVDMGTTVPRVSYGTGRNGEVTRTDDGDGTWTITTSAEPTLVATGCDPSSWPWTCPTTAPDQALRLSAQALDWHQWEDSVQRRAFFGVDFWTNVEVTSFPPGVMYDDLTGIARMQLDFGAPHFETDGVTEYRGHFEAVLPNDFLRENFYIPDPGTMTTASLAVAGGGPVSTTTVTKASPASPVEIEVTDMTFSTRRLRVQTGTVVPTRPGNLRATRTSTRAGRLDYDLATPRGAKVTGYRARCVPASGSSVTATLRDDASPLRVTGLTSGRTYWCRVRALSRAGAGPWSTSDRMTS
jgi:hypothetical protein